MNALRDFVRLDAGNKRYVLFLSAIWLVGYFSAFWRRVGVAELFVPVTNTVFLSMLALMCSKTWKNRIRVSDMALYLLLALVFFLNAIIFPKTANLVENNIVNVVLATFPYLFFG